MIYTSYFANLKKIPSEVIPVAICAKKPDFYKGLIYSKLAPSYDALMMYKKDNNVKDYMIKYKAETLSKLDPKTVVTELGNLTNNAKDIVLLCYEKPDSYCHRQFVAEWLSRAGYPCQEFKAQ